MLSRKTYSNDGSAGESLDRNFEDSVKRTSTKTFSQKVANTYGALATIEVSDAAFSIGPAAAGGYGWKKTGHHTGSLTENQEVTIHWGLGSRLKHGESVACQAIGYQGRLSFEYEARATVSFEDSIKKISYRENGTLDQTSWSQGEFTVTPLTVITPTP